MPGRRLLSAASLGCLFFSVALPRADEHLPSLAPSDVPPTPLFDCHVPRPEPAPLPGTAPIFPKTAISFPPIVYANANRTFWEIMLLYWSKTDPEAGSRLRLIAPFYLNDCTPTARTTLTPLFGYKRDADGIAGFAANYYFRRDANRRSDVLFPLFWNLTARRPDGSVESASLALPPLVFHSETADHATTVAPLFYLRTATHIKDWNAAFFPLLFIGQSQTRAYAYLPPLLTFFHKERAS